MSMPAPLPTALISDIDGVLLNNSGYRKAFDQTLQAFFHELNIDQWFPATEELGIFFESNGVTNEWDMVPVVAAAVYDCAVQQLGIKPCQLPPDLPALNHLIRTTGKKTDRLNLTTRLEQIRPYLSRHKVPGMLFLDAASSPAKTVFQYLSAEIVTEIFSNPCSVEQNPWIQAIQTRVLGSEQYESAYQIPARFSAVSTLIEYDRLLIEESILNVLRTQWETNQLGICLMTSRPSLPPRDVQTAAAGYSNEGELAQQLLNMMQYPMIAYGRLEYFGKTRHADPLTLVKPSLFHGLSCILAAFIRQENQAMELAWSFQQGELSSLPLPDRFQVIVLEDSPIGLTSCALAAQQLRQVGYQIELHLCGISPHHQKQQALQNAGAVIYRNVNTAIKASFSS